MITIIKGKDKIICSYKTYDEQFRQLGYVPVSNGEKANEKTIKKETAKEVVIEPKKEASEEEKIGSKYGVKRRTTSVKKEE